MTERAGVLDTEGCGSERETPGCLGPLLHVGPIPCRPTADRPLRLREPEFAVSPLVERRSGDAQPLADLDDSHRITDHGDSVSKVLTPTPECEHNTYMADAPQFKIRKTIAEHIGDGHFLTMDEDGQTAEYPTAERVVKALRCRDAAAAKRGDSTATLIEWVHVPEGFEPPQVES